MAHSRGRSGCFNDFLSDLAYGFGDVFFANIIIHDTASPNSIYRIVGGNPRRIFSVENKKRDCYVRFRGRKKCLREHYTPIIMMEHIHRILHLSLMISVGSRYEL